MITDTLLILKLKSENAKLRELNTELLCALRAYHDHFGVLEDNYLLHQDARNCSRLAEAVISKANN